MVSKISQLSTKSHRISHLSQQFQNALIGFKTLVEVVVIGSKRGALTRCELPHGLLAANQPFSEFLHQPPPSSSHHSPSIEGPIHLQLISTPTVNTITMVAIARSFGAARVAARGFSNAGMSRACRSSSSHWV